MNDAVALKMCHYLIEKIGQGRSLIALERRSHCTSVFDNLERLARDVRSAILEKEPAVGSPAGYTFTVNYEPFLLTCIPLQF